MRLPARPGERIRRDEPRTFTFEGREIRGFAGDTIASALFADGRRIFTRSFKYHRPRGLMCCSGNCASCLMEVDDEPSVRVCMRPLEGGEVVRPQVVAGSLERDPLRLIDRAGGPFLPVGFYYRMGIRPRFAWPHVERALRRLTGAGRAAGRRPAAARSDVEHRSVDVLVIGGGRSGRAAAERHAAAGRDVVVVDERPEAADLRIEGVEVIAPARALGVFEGRLVPVHAGALVHRLRARRLVIATGTIDQPLLFDGNDLPGVMTPGGASRLLEQWSILPGRRAVVVAADDAGVMAAERLAQAGAEVLELVDMRSVPQPALRARARKGVLASVEIDGRRVACDLLVASAGRQPAYSLLAQAGCSVAFDADRGIFAPTDLADGVEAVGSVSGEHASAIAPGDHGLGSRCFVCPCEDVTAKDVVRAVAEGFDGIEIAKRYTTVTMGPCQGRLCHLHAVRLLARATRQDDAAVGTTTARPPWTPTALGAIAGRPHVPGKRTPLHDRHRRHGAAMVWTGPWRRPQDYGDAAAEIRAVHASAGLMDVSTLGKLLITGPEARAFLDGVFPNRMLTLEVGRVRYVVLNTESGRMIDDGTVVRLADDSFLVTTTSGGADLVYETFCLWRDLRALDAEIVNVTGALAAVAISGPAARRLLERVSEVDVAADALPYLSARQGVVCGVPALLMRIGFLGELGFELHFPAAAAEHVWDALLAAGSDLRAVPVGVEALKVLRLEKGHIILGIDTDPESTMLDLGAGRMIAWDKGDFVGRAALERMRARGVDRRLVGFSSHKLPREGTSVLVGPDVRGRVTSARRSEEVGRVIGLAYVPVELARQEASFEIDMGDGRRASANVHLGPFFDPDERRVARVRDLLFPRRMWRSRGALRKRYDVVIIGGGVQGLAVAYYLARHHGVTDVAVLEKGYIGSGGSGRNTAIVRSNYRTPESARFYQASLDLYDGLSRELGFNIMLTKRGVLTLAHSERALATATERASVNQQLGIDSRVIGVEDIRRLCPSLDLSPDVTWPVMGALLHPGGAILRHDAVVWGYARAADRLGAEIHQFTEVTGLERRDGRIRRVHTSRGDVEAGTVLSATAGWSGLVAGMAGLRLPMRTYVLQAFVTEPIRPLLRETVVSSQMRIYIHQTTRGELVAGTEVEPYPTYSGASTLRFLETASRHMVELFPRLRDVSILRTWSGLCDLTPDYSPIIDRTPLSNFVVTAGWGTYGFKAAPLVGVTVARLIATGETDPLIAPFGFRRFADDRLISETASAAMSH